MAPSFNVPKGSITALVGINGSGKSTLFKSLMGFVPLAGGGSASWDERRRR
jgi:manganese/iron transport system ATP-binding protein